MPAVKHEPAPELLPDPSPATNGDDADAEALGGRRLDPELRAMGAMLRMLAELDPEARGRVVRYLSSRFPA